VQSALLPLHCSSRSFKKTIWAICSLPFLQKEQQGAARTLALSKKSNAERLTPSLFTKRATIRGLLPCSLWKNAVRSDSLEKKSEERITCFFLTKIECLLKISKRECPNVCPAHREGWAFALLLFAIFCSDKKSNSEWLALSLSTKRVTRSNSLPCSLQKEQTSELLI